MATARQQQQLNQLQPILNSIASYDPALLIQKERLGSDLCFEFLSPLLNEVVASVQKLLKLDLGKVPYGVLNQLQAPFQNISNTYAQIGAFSPAGHGNAIAVRDNLALSLEDQWNGIYLTVSILLGAPGDENVRKEIEVLTTQIRTTTQLSSDALNALNTKKQEIEQTLESFLSSKAEEFTTIGEQKLRQVTGALDEVRKAAMEAGVSQRATYFKEEADEHLASARVWLVALIFLVVCLFFFSLFGTHVMSLAGVPEPASDASNILQIKYLIQKGMIVFGLLYGLMWASRNYGASRHNYVVNKHRSNALGSFQAFAASASDAETKSAVLIQATQSIFSPQASGYVKNDGDNSPTSPIIEILRSVGSKEK